MIKIKNQLSKKEIKEIFYLIQSINDVYGEFYLTKNNLRLFIRENFNILLTCLRKGDKIVWDTSGDGIAILTGWSDKSKRKYVKILVKNNKIVDKLLKVISWEIRIPLFIKLKRKNPILKIFYDNGYTFFAGRGKEILLKRKPNKYFNIEKQNKDEE